MMLKQNEGESSVFWLFFDLSSRLSSAACCWAGCQNVVYLGADHILDVAEHFGEESRNLAQRPTSFLSSAKLYASDVATDT